MKKNMLAIATCLAILMACGPSKEQLAAEEKRRTDSISAAAQQQLLDQQAAEALAVETAAEQERLKQELMELRSELAGAEVKMENIRKFQLLRSTGEKEEQVTAQALVIEQIKSRIAETERQIN